MQYNSEANHNDIVTLSEKLSKSNSSSFKILDKTLYANIALKIIWGWIFEAYNGWHYDDTNQTDIPEATGTLNANETFITLPIDSAHLLGVAYKDTAGNWNKLKPITIEQIEDMGYAENNFMSTAGNPQYYRPLANGFRTYPAPNFTQAASWGIWFSRDMVSFTITDTTAVPGFPSEFHEAVPTYMALQQAKLNAPTLVLGLQKDWDGNEDVTGKEGGFKLRIKSFYGNRFRQLFPPRMRSGDAVRDYL